MDEPIRGWRSTRAILLRYEDAGNCAYYYNELMEKGSAWGHQVKIAEIGEGKVLDVRLIDDGILILYAQWS